MALNRLRQYVFLMRLHKPIGILLLLWPTLWALWLAGSGHPSVKIVWIFILGVILTRSAGCVINDIADRHVDAHVHRTRERPLAAGKVRVSEAVILAMVLGLAAFGLVLLCNPLTVLLAFVGAALAIVYPLLKRVTHLPQIGLGLAFSWGVPMAFAAQNATVSAAGWYLYFVAMLWPVIYDTLYAMTDREDDMKIGVKSTAILFGGRDKMIIGLLQLLFLGLLIPFGMMFSLGVIYYFSLVIVAGLFVYQQWLIHTRDPAQCFAAFLNNNWVGLVIWMGIVI